MVRKCYLVSATRSCIKPAYVGLVVILVVVFGASGALLGDQIKRDICLDLSIVAYSLNESVIGNGTCQGIKCDQLIAELYKNPNVNTFTAQQLHNPQNTIERFTWRTWYLLTFIAIVVFVLTYRTLVLCYYFIHDTSQETIRSFVALVVLYVALFIMMLVYAMIDRLYVLGVLRLVVLDRDHGELRAASCSDLTCNPTMCNMFGMPGAVELVGHLGHLGNSIQLLEPIISPSQIIITSSIQTVIEAFIIGLCAVQTVVHAKVTMIHLRTKEEAKLLTRADHYAR